jgi:hypothetical protein
MHYGAVRRFETGSLTHRRPIGIRWMLRILKFWIVLRPCAMRHKFKLFTGFAAGRPRGRAARDTPLFFYCSSLHFAAFRCISQTVHSRNTIMSHKARQHHLNPAWHVRITYVMSHLLQHFTTFTQPR